MSDIHFLLVSDMPVLSKHLISNFNINRYQYTQLFAPKTEVNLLVAYKKNSSIFGKTHVLRYYRDFIIKPIMILTDIT